MRDGALAFRQRQQQMRQQKAGQIIHGKAQLVPVAALLPLWPLVLRTDAGIADEDVEPLVIGQHALGELSRLRQRRQVGLIENRRRAAGPLDVVDHSICPRRVTAVDQQFCALRGKLGRDIAADTVGRAGDEDGLALHVHRETLVTAPAPQCRPI